jgi:hypothetical protein
LALELGFRKRPVASAKNKQQNYGCFVLAECPTSIKLYSLFRVLTIRVILYRAAIFLPPGDENDGSKEADGAPADLTH